MVLCDVCLTAVIASELYTAAMGSSARQGELSIVDKGMSSNSKMSDIFSLC